MNHIVKREINIYMIALGTVLLIALLFTIKMNYEAFTNFYFILTEEEKATYLNEPNTKSLLVGPSLCLIAIIGFIVRKKLGWIPRYAIVDKAGNIVQDKALSPDDIRLPKLLAQYGAKVKSK
jgi:hypothetical protein